MHFPHNLVRDFAICASNEFRCGAENDAAAVTMPMMPGASVSITSVIS
jgi:hypothetical protein